MLAAWRDAIARIHTQTDTLYNQCLRLLSLYVHIWNILVHCIELHIYTLCKKRMTHIAYSFSFRSYFSQSIFLFSIFFALNHTHTHTAKRVIRRCAVVDTVLNFISFHWFALLFFFCVCCSWRFFFFISSTFFRVVEAMRFKWNHNLFFACIPLNASTFSFHFKFRWSARRIFVRERAIACVFVCLFAWACTSFACAKWVRFYYEVWTVVKSKLDNSINCLLA